MKKALLYVNGKLEGTYTQAQDQSIQDFESEADYALSSLCAEQAWKAGVKKTEIKYCDVK